MYTRNRGRNPAFTPRQEAEDRAFRRRMHEINEADFQAEVDNDAPTLDLTCDQDRRAGRLVPLDRLFK